MSASKITHISSEAQYNTIISSHTIVVTDFWATWCGPCRAIAPVYEQLAAQLARPGAVAFVKVDTDAQSELARKHGITAMPTFTVLKRGREVRRIQGADARQLNEAVRLVAAEADKLPADTTAGGSGDFWSAVPPTRGYSDITAQVDTRGLDLMNGDGESSGGPRLLFDGSKPSVLAGGSGKAKGKSTAEAARDWIESDTDDQLMLYIPFQAVLKIHTLQLTSLPTYSDDADEEVMRPRAVHLYVNQAHNLGFDEAEGIEPTQKLELTAGDWDAETGTAIAELRFVRFQKVSSLVIFVVNGDGNGERVRLDRIRLVGDAGERQAMGKLEKIGDEPGEG